MIKTFLNKYSFTTLGLVFFLTVLVLTSSCSSGVRAGSKAAPVQTPTPISASAGGVSKAIELVKAPMELDCILGAESLIQCVWDLEEEGNEPIEFKAFMKLPLKREWEALVIKIDGESTGIQFRAPTVLVNSKVFFRLQSISQSGAKSQYSNSDDVEIIVGGPAVASAITQPLTQSTTLPLGEPLKQPNTVSVTQPNTVSVTQPNTVSVTQPSTVSVTQPVVQSGSGFVDDGKPKLRLDNFVSTLDFGPKPLAVPYTWPVGLTITNVGTKPLILRIEKPSELAFEITPSSTCMNGQGMGQNYYCYIMLSFTGSERKSYEGRLKIWATNEYGDSTPYEMALRGSVYSLEADTPRITINQESANFGSMAIGSNGTVSLVLTNGGVAAQVNLGQFPPGVSLLEGSMNTCKHVLQNPGDQCYFTLKISSSTPGPVGGILQIGVNSVTPANPGASVAGQPINFSIRADFR